MESLTSTASLGGQATQLKLKICYCAIATAVLTHLVMMIVLLSIVSSANHGSWKGYTYCRVEISACEGSGQGQCPDSSSMAVDKAIQDHGCILVGGLSSSAGGYHVDRDTGARLSDPVSTVVQAMMCPEGGVPDYCI